MKVRHLTAAALVALALTACSTDDPKPVSPPVMPGTSTTAATSSSSSTPGVLDPMGVGVSSSTGVEVSIISVEDVNTRYGPAVAITYQLHNPAGNPKGIFDAANFPTPSLVFGPAGTPAENVVSMSEGYGEGAKGMMPPGARQTVKYAYKASKAELNPAVITAGSSVVWQGDFTGFAR